jgi:hypothetical protein
MDTIGIRREERGAAYERFANEGSSHVEHSGNKLVLPDDVEEHLVSYDAVLFARQAGDAHDVSIGDVKQRQLGDCYFHATLAALTMTDDGRALLHNAVRENKDRDGKTISYTVVLHEKNGPRFCPTEIVVPRGTLPIVLVRSESGAMVRATPSDPRRTQAHQAEMWAVAIEHAFILHSGGAARVTGGRPTHAMELLTGKPAVQHFVPVPDDPRPTADDYTPERLCADLRQGKIVVASTREKSFVPKENSLHLTSNHSYAVTSVRQRDGTWEVTLHNPWGTEPDCTVPLSEWRRCFDSFDVGSP